MATLIARDSIIGMIAAPLIWAVHFLVIYVLNASSCAFGFASAAQSGWGTINTVLVVVTAVALLGIGGFGFLAYRRWRQSGHGRRPTDEVEARHRFMALSALLLSILSAIAVIYETIPVFILSPCQ